MSTTTVPDVTALFAACLEGNDGVGCYSCGKELTGPDQVGRFFRHTFTGRRLDGTEVRHTNTEADCGPCADNHDDEIIWAERNWTWNEPVLVGETLWRA